MKKIKKILIILLLVILLMGLMFSTFRPYYFENAETLTPGMLTPGVLTPGYECSPTMQFNEKWCKLKNYIKNDSTYSIPESEIISLTYKALIIWPDGVESKFQEVINDVTSSISIYFPNGKILNRDALNVENSKKQLMPMTNVINKGNMSLGINPDDRLTQLNSISKDTGNNLYMSVSKNDDLTKLYTKYLQIKETDTEISIFATDNKKLTDDYFKSVTDVQTKYKTLCEELDFKRFINLKYKMGNVAMADVLMGQYNMFKNDKNTFNSLNPILSGFEKTSMPIENIGMPIESKVIPIVFDEDSNKKLSDGLLYQMKNIRNVWNSWVDFYVYGSNYLIDASYSALTEEWKSKSKKFKDDFSKWINYEIGVSNAINSRKKDLNSVLNVLQEVKNDKSHNSEELKWVTPSISMRTPG